MMNGGVEIVRYDGEALDSIATLQRGHVLLRKPAEKHWPLLILHSLLRIYRRPMGKCEVLLGLYRKCLEAK